MQANDKRTILTLVALALLAALTISPRPAFADPALPPEIQTLLTLPEEKIDIGMAALIFAHSINGTINIPAYSAKIDHLADEVRAAMGPQATPDQAREAMSAVIYGKEGYHYDFSNAVGPRSLDYFLSGTLDSKLGTCTNLPMLYMAVAQRVALPVYPVLAPDHFFLRFNDPRVTSPNIEATSGGGVKADNSYIQWLHITPAAMKSGTYMRTMTRHEYLAVLLATNGFYYLEANKPDKALAYYEAAWTIDPHIDSVAMGMTQAYFQKSSIDVSDFWQAPQTSDGLDRGVEDLNKARSWNKTLIDMGANWEDHKLAPPPQ